jgi:glyoxylase-like metal-dependent hydrolase (beta-lactamase superfamily II)
MIEKISYGSSNCYLVQEKENFLLVDTELPGNKKEMIKTLEDYGVNNLKFKLIVLTHGHVDHVGNALALKEHFGVKIAMNAMDSEMVEKSNTTFPKAHIFFSKMLRFMLSIKNTKFTYQAFKPDILLKDGDTLDKFGVSGKVIALPGHTLGSIGILNQGDFFIGDAGMFLRGTLVPPIFGESNDKMKATVKKIKSMPCDAIYTGH